MSELRKAAQQALEALDADPDDMVEVTEGRWEYKQEQAWKILRAALAQPEPTTPTRTREEIEGAAYSLGMRYLAQPEPEPVAWMQESTGCIRSDWGFDKTGYVPLYAHPPQRKPLTDEEIQDLAKSMDESVKWPLCRAIEKAHGIGGEE